jgi:adenylate cyclase
MPENQGKLTRFWQELKRRNVFRVTATYAATAYIIIEVINNLAIPLRLPLWVSTLVLIILIIGLPIAVILSWIFDFTPQGIKKMNQLKNWRAKKS